MDSTYRTSKNYRFTVEKQSYGWSKGFAKYAFQVKPREALAQNLISRFTQIVELEHQPLLTFTDFPDHVIPESELLYFPLHDHIYRNYSVRVSMARSRIPSMASDFKFENFSPPMSSSESPGYQNLTGSQFRLYDISRRNVSVH